MSVATGRSREVTWNSLDGDSLFGEGVGSTHTFCSASYHLQGWAGKEPNMSDCDDDMRPFFLCENMRWPHEISRIEDQKKQTQSAA